jgi:hypothetical protein
MQLMMLPLRH